MSEKLINFFITVLVVSLVVSLYFSFTNKNKTGSIKQYNSNGVKPKPPKSSNENTITPQNTPENIVSTTNGDIVFEKLDLLSLGTGNNGFISELVVDRNGQGIMYASLRDYAKTKSDEPRVVVGREELPMASLIINEELGQCSIEEQNASLLRISRKFKNRPIVVVEEWKLQSDSYQIAYKVTFKNSSNSTLELHDLICNTGGVRAKPLVVKSSRASVDGLIDIRFANPAKNKSYKIKDIKKLDSEEKKEMRNQQIEWVASHSKYFMSFIKPVDFTFSGAKLKIKQLVDGDDSDKKSDWLAGELYFPSVKLPASGSKSYVMNCYIGPKESRRISKLGTNVSRVLNMDRFFGAHAFFMDWASRHVILNFLISLKERIFNFSWGYGLGIVLITLIIKMALWPLTNKSNTSMRSMQEVQPKMKEIREKYKDNPQKMNQKVMELYRDHGVNPMGGCWPMLVQIPIFFTLFNTFRNAIELRHASFLWVVDLSSPDTIMTIASIPVRPLALLMGVTMILQQRIMPKTGDKNQANMMMMMSVVMVFFFYSMPAGLTLYWTVNQLVSILQMAITQKKVKSDMASS